MQTKDYLSSLQNDKRNYVDKLVEKGVEASYDETFTELIPKMDDIQSGSGGSESSGEWQRPTDWWDCKTILENAEEIDGLYPAYIMLLADWDKETTFSKTASYKATQGDGFLTSDGSWYVGNATHTWDTTKDKPCSEGYKTRYVIVYVTNPNSVGAVNIQQVKMLELIIGNITLSISSLGSSNNSNDTNHYIRNFETFSNTVFSSISTYLFAYCRGIENISLPNATEISSYFALSCIILKKVYLPKVISIPNLAFRYCYLLKNVNFPNVTTFIGANNLNSCFSLEKFVFLPSYTIASLGNVINDCYSLKELNLYNDFDKSGLNVSTCYALTRACLLDILNKLKDVTEDTENTYTLTLGKTNLGKLKEEEIAIGTGKGWVIN